MVDGKNTGIQVYSGVVESGNDFKSDGVWKSQSYSEKENEYNK